ncbi:MAG: glutamine synthetase family protein [Bacteroidota bacterium]
MTQEEIKQKVSGHPAHKVKLAITDIDGILRGKVVHKDKLMSIVDGGFGFCNVVFGWDAVDTAYDNAQYTGWHTGYPDANAQLDINTFRQIPWEENLPFFLGDFVDESGEGLAVCPRSLLKKVRQEAVDLGYSPMFSQEFEWFNFAETPETLNGKSFTNIEPLTPGMFGYSLLRSSLNSPFFNDLFDLLLQFDVPLEGLHTETGPGVYEAAILYGDILEAADRAVLFKTAVKEIAYQHGIMATFMAKWNQQLPGCSGHIHQSLWDSDRQTNLFFDEADAVTMSVLMQGYVAGQLYCLPYILPMYAPTINSYKRLVEGAWAPTTLTWGTDNRTTALRVLAGGKKSTRLETRVPGSDVNPYLAMTAALASGLYGIKNDLKLDQPKTIGNGYEEEQYGILPRNLWEASQAMKTSDLATELFGADFVDHFIRTREWECRQYAQAVTDWELKRYFEII